MSKEIEARNLGIQQTAEGAAFFGALVTSVVRVADDGKFKWFEAVQFQRPAALLPAAIDGYKQIGAELRDLDPVEATQVSNAFAQEAQLDNSPEGEELAEEGAEIALKLLAYINKVRDFRDQKETA
jgi:hypothetical protein